MERQASPCSGDSADDLLATTCVAPRRRLTLGSAKRGRSASLASTQGATPPATASPFEHNAPSLSTAGTTSPASAARDMPSRSTPRLLMVVTPTVGAARTATPPTASQRSQADVLTQEAPPADVDITPLHEQLVRLDEPMTASQQAIPVPDYMPPSPAEPLFLALSPPEEEAPCLRRGRRISRSCTPAGDATTALDLSPITPSQRDRHAAETWTEMAKKFFDFIDTKPLVVTKPL